MATKVINFLAIKQTSFNRLKSNSEEKLSVRVIQISKICHYQAR